MVVGRSKCWRNLRWERPACFLGLAVNALLGGNGEEGALKVSPGEEHEGNEACLQITVPGAHSAWKALKGTVAGGQD